MGWRLRAAGTGARGRDRRTGARVSGSASGASARATSMFSAMLGVRVAALATSDCGPRAGRGLTATRSGLGGCRRGVERRAGRRTPSGRAIGVRRDAVSVGAHRSARRVSRATAGRGPAAGAPAATPPCHVPGPRRDSGAHPRSRAGCKVDRHLRRRVAPRVPRPAGATRLFGHVGALHDAVQRVIGVGRDDHTTKGRHHGGDGDRRNDGVYGLNAITEHAPDRALRRTR
jgi:hypothetical protein